MRLLSKNFQIWNCVFKKKICFFNAIVRTCEMSFMKVSLFQIIKFKCVIQTFINSNCVFTSIIPSERYTYHMQQISKHFAGNIKTSSTMLFLYMCFHRDCSCFYCFWCSEIKCMKIYGTQVIIIYASIFMKICETNRNWIICVAMC